MQYVNDDMDELFRKAAKDYPLNTGSADWEKVKKALDELPAGNTSPSRKNNYRHFLWLLLLLPLPWICTRYSGEGGRDVADALTGKEKSSVLPREEHNNNGAAMKNKDHTGHKNGSETMIGSGREQVQQRSDIKEGSSALEQNNQRGNVIALTVIQRRNNLVDTDLLQEGVSEVREKNRSEINFKESERDADLTAEQVIIPDKQEDSVASIKDTAQKDTTATSTPPANKQPKSQRVKRFYAGILGGADITSIEMQKVKKVGYDLGGVFGYSINNKWSVETGLLSSEKAYYSSGKYMGKVYLMPGTTLREAEGDCRMWEVPVVVRYQFITGKKGNWFASAGSSSYFMKKESYDYTYYYATTGQEVKRSRSYSSNSRHLFAAVQVSGGYNRHLGNLLDLRVEPYLKLPLRKVGLYDLPLTSFGVHVGVTKKLF